MKTLITASDINNKAVRGEKLVHLHKDTIITPAARDAAREMGIQIVYTENEIAADNNRSCCSQEPVQEKESAGDTDRQDAGSDNKDLLSLVTGNLPNQQADPELVARIVKEVLAALGYVNCNTGPVIEKDKSGLQLVRGDSVVCEPFSTGSPKHKVFLKDLLPVAESPNMAVGFMEIDNSSFEWELKYDEYDYVIDGELEIIVNGQTYRGKPGDVFFIPRGTRIIFSSPGKVKFFYTTYPANWQEIV